MHTRCRKPYGVENQNELVPIKQGLPYTLGATFGQSHAVNFFRGGLCKLSAVAFHFFPFLAHHVRAASYHSELAALSHFLSAFLSNLQNMTDAHLFCSGPTSGGSHDGLIPWTRFCKV